MGFTKYPGHLGKSGYRIVEFLHYICGFLHLKDKHKQGPGNDFYVGGPE